MSKLQTMVLGLHCWSVSSVAVADPFSMILSFSFATCATASATDDVGTSIIASTPCVDHCRAMEEATSGLFWWSGADHFHIETMDDG